MSLSSVIKLTPVQERVMRVLAAAAIDPGDLTWTEVMVRATLNRNGATRATNKLVKLGLVTTDKHGVTWTEAGRQLAILNR